jgi:hypothetical protein
MNNDTQREMEQRALRNVRGLLDKFEEKDAVEERAVKKTVVTVVAGVVVLVVAVGLAMWLAGGKKAAKTIEIPPPAGAPK